MGRTKGGKEGEGRKRKRKMVWKGRKWRCKRDGGRNGREKEGKKGRE